MVNRHGLLSAIHRRIQSGTGSDVSPILKELGMADYSFEAVGSAYPEHVRQAAA